MMQAAWYERNGAARDVLVVGELPTPTPAAGQMRVRLYASGVNPSDVKSRMARPLGGPRIVPHSDGVGLIDAVGEGVSASRIGERVWTWNAQWQRPDGTSAQFVVLPSPQAVLLLVYDLAPADRQACLAQLSSMLSQGVLKHSIGAVFPLKDIVMAHETVEAGQTIGNVVLDIGH